MNEIEAVLGLAIMHMKRGEPLPLDLLVKADELGISVKHLDQPSNSNDANFQEGDILNGTENYI